ncbi:hypothetical protein F2Q68_00021145 [Brassica cretica]|uniref:Uncharacterized protein n=1 Tax=Brassica cretica TaxID=69181 RepID=A0A8S9G1V5_BRACR|nr:hypothetical protein F2Q68_00021145 [Brassica cretica]
MSGRKGGIRSTTRPSVFQSLGDDLNGSFPKLKCVIRLRIETSKASGKSLVRERAYGVDAVGSSASR